MRFLAPCRPPFMLLLKFCFRLSSNTTPPNSSGIPVTFSFKPLVLRGVHFAFASRMPPPLLEELLLSSRTSTAFTFVSLIGLRGVRSCCPDISLSFPQSRGCAGECVESTQRAFFDRAKLHCLSWEDVKLLHQGVKRSFSLYFHHLAYKRFYLHVGCLIPPVRT